MRQGARKENIDPKSSTDEQRRRIAKGLQPLVGWPGLTAWLCSSSVTERCGYAPSSGRASQSDRASAIHPYL